MRESVSTRTILAGAMVGMFGVSTLFVIFGFSVYSLLTQSLNTLLLMGLYWKMSDLVRRNEELARDLQRERDRERVPVRQ